VQALTKQIYTYIGAKGIIRVDYIIIGNEPHLLEVNTTPGMTATSFIPQEVRAAGLNIQDVMDDVIQASMKI
ncbi:MAG: D-alanine--D-alanine ligase, partial [Bacteroidales bacterium]|nr:D-alanine--D-alanine ligase [Bacteroidales bacterium]